MTGMTTFFALDQIAHSFIQTTLVAVRQTILSSSDRRWLAYGLKGLSRPYSSITIKQGLNWKQHMKKLFVGIGFLLSVLLAILLPVLIVRAIYYQNVYETINHFGTLGHIFFDCLSTVLLINDPLNPFGPKRILVYVLTIFVGPIIVVGYHQLAEKISASN
jgi:hypothetical protein